MRKSLAIILSLTILCLMFSVVSAESQTFTVSAGGSSQVTINLSQGDAISGTVSVSGGSGNDVNFRAADPYGNILESRDRTTYNSFSFTASTTGSYTLTFDNSFSWISSKSVTLDYSVQPAVLGGAIGGLSVALLIVAILGILLIVVVVMIVLRKRPKQMQVPPPPP